MTGPEHRSSRSGNSLAGLFIIVGTLLSISISINAVLYVIFTWDLGSRF